MATRGITMSGNEPLTAADMAHPSLSLGRWGGSGIQGLGVHVSACEYVCVGE